MANRHLARSIVLQTLFEIDFNEKKVSEKEALKVLKRNIEEFAPGSGDFSFIQNLLKNILAKMVEHKLIEEIKQTLCIT